MTATVVPAQDAVFIVLRTFIKSIINCEVIQGLGNYVSMPVGGFIAITPLFQTKLSTNYNTFHDGTFDTVPTSVMTQSSLQAAELTIQIDCYGVNSAEWATAISTLLRDDYGCIALAPYCQPLHADDPKQIPLITGEENFEQRWTLNAVLQYNPVTTVPIEFFDEAIVSTINVEATYTLQ